jgi:type II secretory pathway component PulF
MPFLVTPGQFSRRADLYHQLSSLTAAGVGLMQALEQLQRHPPSPGFREALRRVLDQLRQGATFTEAIQRAGHWTVAFDIALIDAGERSGRLEQCFRLLGDYYAGRARTAREVISGLAYPAFVMHFAVFIFPFPQLFLTGNVWAYLAQTFGVLLPVYAGVLMLIYAGQGGHGEAWRAVIEQALRAVPLLGSGRRDLALARLAAALEALLSAGVGVIESWDLAARASGSPALARTVAHWRPRVTAGETPAEALGRSAEFPELFANQYATGEVSGKLDETLRRLHRYYQDEGTRKLQAIAQWTPRLVYLIVAGIIAWRIISFWLGYFDQIQKIGGF